MAVCMHISGFTVYLITRNTRRRNTGIRGLMRGMATLPQGHQELLVVRDKVGRPQVSLGQASPWNVIFFPSVL